MVLFEKDALYTNYPEKLLLISMDHAILYKGKMIKAKYFAEHFGEKIRIVDYKEDYIYNILMEKHEKMKVHNMIVETLHPSNPIAQKYIEKKQKQIRTTI